MNSVFGMTLCIGAALIGVASIALDTMYGQPGSSTGFLASLQQFNSAVDSTTWLLLFGLLIVFLIVLEWINGAILGNLGVVSRDLGKGVKGVIQ